MDAQSLALGAVFLLVVVGLVWYLTCAKCRGDTQSEAAEAAAYGYPRATISTGELEHRLNLGFYKHFTFWHPGGKARMVYMPFRTPSASQLYQKRARCSNGHMMNYLEFLSCHCPSADSRHIIYLRLGDEPHFYRVAYGDFLPC